MSRTGWLLLPLLLLSCGKRAPGDTVGGDTVDTVDSGTDDTDTNDTDDTGCDLVWYADTDGDGHGDASKSVSACAAPEGYVADGDDCDDTDAAFHPGAPETDCSDPNDYNCDGSTGQDDKDADGVVACQDCDDADASVTVLTFYGDADGDGFGDASVPVTGCEAPAGYVANASDCDDADASVLDGVTWYRDADGDGFGDAKTTVYECSAPSGYVAAGTDCDDGSADVFPGAEEWCDGVDDDCNGTTDDAYATDAPTWYADADGDGYGDAAAPSVSCDAGPGEVADATDCDDAAKGVHPGASETCNAKDDDCNGTIDDDYATDATTYYADADGDGYGDPGASKRSCLSMPDYTIDGTDCDDGNSAINPAATEVCDAADTDEDCDGAADNADSGATGTTTFYADADGDGFGSPTSSADLCDATSAYPSTNHDDCDDTNSSVRPGGTEVCDAANTDEDCDGYADNADGSVSVSTETTWYADADGDGYGGTASALQCDASTSYPVATSTDCDDANKAANPGATEVCDASNTDEDCDGAADDADSSVSASSKTTWYADADADGYGGSTSSARCDADATYTTATSGDCDDGDTYVYPGAVELCDGQANDCSTSSSWTTASENGKASTETTAGVWADVTSSVSGTSASSYKSYKAPSDATVWLCDGTFYAYVDINGSNTTIRGRNGASSTVIESSISGYVVNVDFGSESTTIEDVTIDGAGATKGLLIDPVTASAATTLTRVRVIDCKGAFAIAAYNGPMTITDSTIGDATWPNTGGDAIGTNGGTLTLSGNTVSYNQGSGLSVMGGTVVTSTGDTFSNNTAQSYGGGLSVEDGTVTLSGVTISGNSAGLDGGGIYQSGSSTTVSADATTTISKNTVTSSTNAYGGGWYLNGGTATVTGATISGNTASATGSGKAQGGGVYVAGSGSSFSCSGSGSVSKNTATSSSGTALGGGAWLGNGTISSTSCSWGPSGSLDNSPDDVYVNAVKAYTYGLAATFTCTTAGCK